jgi:hypothetical protein
MGEVFIWRFFNEIIIRQFVWGEKTDDAVVRNTLDVEIPQVLDYLERELPSGGSFFFGAACSARERATGTTLSVAPGVPERLDGEAPIRPAEPAAEPPERARNRTRPPSDRPDPPGPLASRSRSTT